VRWPPPESIDGAEGIKERTPGGITIIFGACGWSGALSDHGRAGSLALNAAWARLSVFACSRSSWEMTWDADGILGGRLGQVHPAQLGADLTGSLPVHDCWSSCFRPTASSDWGHGLASGFVWIGRP